jgi:ParB/RepB/Spo0J family partition protein
VSWQPGDVSRDARRAAEAAAEAAGVPLKDWFAETVRAAIIRELGNLPAEAPEPKPAAAAPEALEPTPPPAEPIVAVAAAKPDRPPEPAAPPEPVLEPEAAPEPAPIMASEQPAPEPVAAVGLAAPESVTATVSPPPPPISEPDPFLVESAAAVERSVASPIVEAEPPVAAKDAPATTAYHTPGISLGVQRLADRGLSSWLATRIQGLPDAAGRTPAPASPSTPSPPTPAPKPALDLVPPVPIRPPLAPQSRSPEPAPRPATPPIPPLPIAKQPELAALAAQSQDTALPLSLPAGPVKTLSLASLRPPRVRARRPSDVDAAVAVLAASVASQGVREPILVRRLAEKAEQYEVVAGERRRLAAERAGRTDLPAVIVVADDAEALILSLTENLGRGDFSPLDEARAYLRLLTEYRVSPGALAQRLARERSHIVLALRLLGLPPKVRQLVDSGRLAPAQAYSLLGAADPEVMAEQMLQAAAGGPGPA